MGLNWLHAGAKVETDDTVDKITPTIPARFGAKP